MRARVGLFPSIPQTPQGTERHLACLSRAPDPTFRPQPLHCTHLRTPGACTRTPQGVKLYSTRCLGSRAPLSGISTSFGSSLGRHEGAGGPEVERLRVSPQRGIGALSTALTVAGTSHGMEAGRNAMAPKRPLLSVAPMYDSIPINLLGLCRDCVLAVGRPSEGMRLVRSLPHTEKVICGSYADGRFLLRDGQHLSCGWSTCIHQVRVAGLAYICEAPLSGVSLRSMLL
jgi:hypothetical protein